MLFVKYDALNCMNCQLSIVNYQFNFVPLHVIFGINRKKHKNYKEMAKDKLTALLSPVGNAEALATNIIYLIENDEERRKIALNGLSFIKQLSEDKSYKLFKSALNIQ